MFKSPRTFLHVYAALVGILVGLTVWWLSSQIHRIAPFSESTISQQPKPDWHPAGLVTQLRWYLEKSPNKDALDGYELKVQTEQRAVDSEKVNSPWEQIVLLKYQDTATALTMVPLISSIGDDQEKQLAMLMLISLLRAGHVPPNPFPETLATDLVPAPSLIRPGIAAPTPAAPVTTPPPLTDPVRRTKEAQWRREIEAIRTSIVATLDKLVAETLTLDAKYRPAVYLSLAENYDKLHEHKKAASSVDNAAQAMLAAYSHEHNPWLNAGTGLMAKVPSVLAALLGYLLLLNNDLFKKVAAHVTGRQILNWWPTAEMAEAIGKPLPAPKENPPAALPSTAPALLPPGTENGSTALPAVTSPPTVGSALPIPAQLDTIIVSQDASASTARPE